MFWWGCQLRKYHSGEGSLKKVMLKLMSGNALGQLLIFFVTPILSRLYGPDDFANLALLVTFSSLFSIVAGLRFDFVYLREKCNRASYLTVSLVFCSLSAICVFFVSALFKSVEWAAYLFLLSLSSGYMNIVGQFVVADKFYSGFAFAKGLQYLCQALVAVLFGLLMVKEGLVWAMMISQFIFVFILRKTLSFNLSKSVYGDVRGDLFFCVKNSIGTILQYSTPMAPVLLLGALSSKESVGMYFFVAQLLSAPLNIFRRSFAYYLNTEFSSREKVPDFKKSFFTRKFTLLVLAAIIVVLIASVGVYVWGEFLFLLAFGEGWGGAGEVAWLLLMYFVFDSLVQPFSGLLSLWGRERLHLFIEIFRWFIVFFGIYMVSVFYNISSMFSILLMYCVVMLFFGFLILILLKREAYEKG